MVVVSLVLCMFVVYLACRPVMCEVYCEYGWAKDVNTGCDICACYNPCNVSELVMLADALTTYNSVRHYIS